MDSEGIGPEEWKSYYEFLTVVRDGLTVLVSLQLPIHIRFKRHLDVIQRAYKTVNSARPHAKLRTLWDRLAISVPEAASSRYMKDTDASTGIDTLARMVYADYWRRYRLDTPDSETLFASADRVKLISSMILSQVNIKKLEKLKLIKTHFPLHRIWEIEHPLYVPPELIAPSSNNPEEEQKGLISHWKSHFFIVKMPFDQIRQYFGEKVGFFFLYLHTYTLWTFALAVLGVLFFIDTVTELDKITNFEENELYCFLTIVWSSLFLEFWKRRQETYAVHWGQIAFEEVEIQRPEFKGKLRRSPVNDDLYEMYYSSGKRLFFQTLGFVFSLLFVILTVATISLILHQRYKVRASGGIIVFHYDLSGSLFGFLSAIQIELFNKLYELMAYRMTELENYRVQSEFENSYILKSFMYQIVNSYASIVYVAFFQTHFEGCYALQWDGTKKTYSCMYDLQVQLAAIYITHFIKNLIVLGKAELTFWRRKQLILMQEDEVRKAWQIDIHNPTTLRTQLEKEFARDSYHAKGIDGTFQDYLELMTQYGYVTLFAVAFPLAPLLACFNNLLELRVDRFKLLSLKRRPVPAGARGIGRWLAVLDIMTTMAVFSNSALLCFTLDAFDDWHVLPDQPIMWFILMLIGIYLVRKGVAQAIPDVPKKYELVKKRHEVVVERHIKKYKPMRRVVSIDSEWVNMAVVGTADS